MKIYISYIARSLIVPIFLTIFTLVSIIWLSQSLKYLPLVMSSGGDFISFILLTFLVIPSFLTIIFPIATFIAIIYLYHKLIIDSEIVVLTNAGVSRFSLSKPVLIIAIVMTIVSYCTTLYLLPISYSNFKDKINFYKENFTSIMLEEKVFNSKIKGLTIYIDERQKDGLLKSILIYDERNAEKPITMIAESGSFIRENNTLKLELKHGSRQELNSKGELSVLYFNYLIHELNISPPKKGTRWRETEERFIEELLFPKENLPEMLKGKLRAEGHQRLAWPLYNIVLSLLALIAVYPSEFDRKHQNKRIIICSTIAIVIVLSFFAMLNVTARFPMLYPFIYLKIILVSLLEYRYLFSDRVLKSI